LCVFDFDPDTRAARVRSMHPGTTGAEVRRQTGFDPGAVDDAPLTPLPTDEQLRLLRERIDVEGSLR
jgi:glutaconate CoA-transferase subunit B